MTKQELIDRIHQQTTENVTKKEIGGVLATLASVAAEALAEGDSIEIPGLARFKVEEREARHGRNPQTGEVLQIPAKNVVKAHIAKALAGRVRG